MVHIIDAEMERYKRGRWRNCLIQFSFRVLQPLSIYLAPYRLKPLLKTLPNSVGISSRSLDVPMPNAAAPWGPPTTSISTIVSPINDHGTATIQLLATFTKSVNAPRPPRTIPSSGRTTTLTVISPSRTPTGRPTKRLRPSPRRSPSRLKSRSANHSPLRRLLVRALTSPSKPIQLIQQPKRKKDLMRKAGILLSLPVTNWS